MTSKTGSVLVFVLILTGLFAAIVGLNLYIAGLRAQAVRAEQKRLEVENRVLSKAFLLRGHVIAELKQEVPGAVKPRLRLDADYYLEDREEALAHTLQEIADRLYCNEVDGVRLAVAFTDEACGEPLPAEVRAYYPGPRKPYLIQGVPNDPLIRFGGFHFGSYYAQRYAIPYVAFATSTTGDTRATAAFAGSFEVDLGPPLPWHFNLIVNQPPPTGWVSFSPNETHEGPILVNGPVQFTGRARLYGRLFVYDNPDGKATFGTLTVPERKMVPSPQAPCYPEGCPLLADGVDWSSPHGGIDLSLINPPAGGNALEINGDVDELLFYRTTTHTHLEVDQGGATTLYRVKDGTGQLESSTDGGGTWSVAVSDFNGAIVVDGAVKSLKSRDPYKPALAGPFYVFADRITVTGPLIYENVPCERYGRDLEGIASKCDPSVKDNLLLVAEQGDLKLAIPPGTHWVLTAHLVARQGSVVVPANQRPVSSLKLLGTLAMHRWSSWGYDTDKGVRTSGVILTHYFDSRAYNGSTFGLSSSKQVDIYGIVPKVQDPLIVRE